MAETSPARRPSFVALVRVAKRPRLVTNTVAAGASKATYPLTFTRRCLHRRQPPRDLVYPRRRRAMAADESCWVLGAGRVLERNGESESESEGPTAAPACGDAGAAKIGPFASPGSLWRGCF